MSQAVPTILERLVQPHSSMDELSAVQDLQKRKVDELPLLVRLSVKLLPHKDWRLELRKEASVLPQL